MSISGLNQYLAADKLPCSRTQHSDSGESRLNNPNALPTELLRSAHYIHRGSYMSAHVLLNLLNELGKRDKMRGLPSILSLFRNEFNKFNNSRARMLDSIYHMTLSVKTL